MCRKSQNCMENPWSNISWSNTIADCDKNYQVEIKLNGKKQKVSFGSPDYVTFINKKDIDDNGKEVKHPVKLNFDYLPEPFYGDRKSEVYCLCMNPGEPDYKFCENNDKQRLYEQYCLAMLNHHPQSKDLIFDGKEIISDEIKYNESIQNIMANLKDYKKDPDNIKFYPRPHLGDTWQREVWKQLIEKLKREPKIFSVEFFPYHSKSGFKFPDYLPSYEYRNDLIDEALREKKLIIIMRMADDWYKIKDRNIGDRLKVYPNKVFLKNSQRVWLTPGNFCWEIPEVQDKTKSLSVPYAEPWACHCLEDIMNKF